MQGHTWADPTQTESEGKLFADAGGGYLAYVLGDHLLVKQFTDQPQSAAAPNEAEIELYVNPDHGYVELETQGAYASIAPGATAARRRAREPGRSRPACIRAQDTSVAAEPKALRFACHSLEPHEADPTPTPRSVNAIVDRNRRASAVDSD